MAGMTVTTVTTDRTKADMDDDERASTDLVVVYYDAAGQRRRQLRLLFPVRTDAEHARGAAGATIEALLRTRFNHFAGTFLCCSASKTELCSRSTGSSLRASITCCRAAPSAPFTCTTSRTWTGRASYLSAASAGFTHPQPVRHGSGEWRGHAAR